MSVFVVDASVVIKWFVPEIHSDAARRLLGLPHQYLAPDLLFAETANAIWKKIKRGEFTAEKSQQLVEDVGRIAVETVPCRVLGWASLPAARVFSLDISRLSPHAAQDSWSDPHREACDEAGDTQNLSDDLGAAPWVRRSPPSLAPARADEHRARSRRRLASGTARQLQLGAKVDF